MFVFVSVKPPYPTSGVTTFAESAVHILYIFANNFGTRRDSLLQKRPIGLLFHAFPLETIKVFIANVL